MARYLIEQTVSSQGTAGMLQNPEDRSEVLRPLFEAAGCRLEHFYASLTENKTYLVVESHDLDSVYPLWQKFVAAGAASSIKVTPVMEIREAVDLMKKAASLVYRPPGN